MDSAAPCDCDACLTAHWLGTKALEFALVDEPKSASPNADKVQFDRETQEITVKYKKSFDPQTLTIGFRLPESGAAGGFAGMNIYQGVDIPPPARVENDFFISSNLRGKTPAANNFEIKPTFDSKGNCTSFVLVDHCRSEGTWKYFVGLYPHARESGSDPESVWNDPKIYNNGGTGDGDRQKSASGWLRRCVAWLLGRRTDS